MPKKPSPQPRPRKASLVKEVSVMAWITNEAGQVLLLKQKRGTALWTLPGGKVNSRETLDGALRRELEEETALKAASTELISIFERPEKANITFLFRVQIKGKGVIRLPAREIEAASYVSRLPVDRTPSLTFFWKRLHSGAPAPLLPVRKKVSQPPVS